VLDKALAFLLGLFLFSACFRGGNVPSVVSAATVIAALVFLVVAWLTVARTAPTPVRAPTLLIVAALLLISTFGAAGWLHFDAVRWLGFPGRAYYRDVVQTLSEPPFSRDAFALSMDPQGTGYSIMVAISCVAVAVGTSRISARLLRLLLGAFCTLVIFEAVLGLLQLALGSPSFLAFGEAVGVQRAAGTFVNKNHYATLLAMALPLLIMRASGRLHFGVSEQSSTVRDVWWGLATALVVVALVSSVSRAGASAGALAATLAIFACRVGATASRARIASALLALLVIAVVLPTGLSMMLKSIDGDALTQSAEGRAALNRLTYAAAKEFFPVGAGLGSYSIAFQRFQNAQLPGYVEHAHNDYLQLLFELGGSGLLVLALLIVATVITARTCYRAWRASGQLASFAFACLSGVVAFSFHAWFDFPAHIPALAWVVTMLAVASTRPDMQPINLADPSTVSRRRRKRSPSGPSDDASPTSATA